MKKSPNNGRRVVTLTVFVLVAGLLAAMAQDSIPSPELPDSPDPAATEQKANPTGASQEQTASPAQAQAGSAAAQKPVGTAAAEKPATTGVAASNVAGAAVAPARQKRSHALLIKVGAIVGAGVALGTVAAFSAASPSRPPGSH